MYILSLFPSQVPTFWAMGQYTARWILQATSTFWLVLCSLISWRQSFAKLLIPKLSLHNSAAGNSNEVTNIIFTIEYLTGRLGARASVISISFAKFSFSWRTPFLLALYNYNLILFSSHSFDYHGTRNSNYRWKNSNPNTLVCYGLLFHMTQPTSRSIIKAIACSEPTISEH